MECGCIKYIKITNGITPVNLDALSPEPTGTGKIERITMGICTRPPRKLCRSWVADSKVHSVPSGVGGGSIGVRRNHKEQVGVGTGYTVKRERDEERDDHLFFVPPSCLMSVKTLGILSKLAYLFLLLGRRNSFLDLWDGPSTC